MINVQTLYQKVLKEEVDKDQFLFQVRRDGRFPFVTNVSSFNDTVKQLKNRGYIQEAKTFKSEDEDFNLMESIHQFGMETKEKEKNPRDYINDYEFQKGWRYEFDKQKEKNVEKAQSAAIKNLQKDDLFYTRLEAGEKKPGKRVDQPVEVKKDNFVDKDNRVKPAKGANKEQNKANVSKKKYPKASKNPKSVKQLKEAIITIAQLMKETDKKKVEEDFSVGKDGKLSSSGKINQSDYKFYVIDFKKNKIISGWEYKEDAFDFKKEFISNNTPNSQLGVYTKIGTKHKGLDPDKNKDWGTDKLSESIFDLPEKQYKGKEVSFTVQDKDDPNKKVRITKVVKAGKKNKNGSFEIAFAGGDRISITKGKQGISSLYFEDPQKPSDYDKVVDIDQSLSKLADKIFPKEQEKQVAEGMYVNKKGKLKDTELQDFLDDVDGKIPVVVIDSEETPEKYPDFKSAEEKHPDLKDDEKYYSILRGKNLVFTSVQVANEHKLRESIKNIIRKKLNENQEPGPTVKKQDLEHLMKNYDWYFEKSDDQFLKGKGQETHDKAMKLIGELGDAGVQIFNDYAPDDKKIVGKEEI